MNTHIKNVIRQEISLYDYAALIARLSPKSTQMKREKGKQSMAKKEVQKSCLLLCTDTRRHGYIENLYLLDARGNSSLLIFSAI